MSEEDSEVFVLDLLPPNVLLSSKCFFLLKENKRRITRKVLTLIKINSHSALAMQIDNMCVFSEPYDISSVSHGYLLNTFDKNYFLYRSSLNASIISNI